MSKGQEQGGAGDGRPAIAWEGGPKKFRPSLDLVGEATYSAAELPVRSVGEGGESFRLTPFLVRCRDGQARLIEVEEDTLLKEGLALSEGQDLFREGRWSRDGIRRFVLEGVRPSVRGVFDAIRANLAFFHEFPAVHTPAGLITADLTVTLISLMVLVSWFAHAFAAVPYVIFSGEKGSGKTKAQRTFTRMAFLGFIVMPSTTVAALKRMLTQGGTVGIDEFETVKRRDFDPEKRALLLAGNTRESSNVMMTEVIGRKRVVVTHSAFGLKVFSNLSGYDDVTADRAIPIRMVRATDTEISAREPESDAPPCPWDRLVDDLYATAMLHSSEVKRTYDTLKVPGLSGREFQIWKPVLALARWIDVAGPAESGEPLFERMLALLEMKRAEKALAVDLGNDYWVLAALVDILLVEKRSNPITLDVVIRKAETLNPDLVSTETTQVNGEDRTRSVSLLTSAKAGRLVRTLQVLDARRADGGVVRQSRGRTYHFSPEAVAARARTYGIKVPDAAGGSPGVGEGCAVAVAGPAMKVSGGVA